LTDSQHCKGNIGESGNDQEDMVIVLEEEVEETAKVRD